VLIAILAVLLLNLGATGYLIWLWFVKMAVFMNQDPEKEPDVPNFGPILARMKVRRRTNSPVKRAKNWLERQKPEVR
jgi:hypothetical protein